MSILAHSFNKIGISQSSEDSTIGGKDIPKGYVNATQMCKANGKALAKYFQYSKTEPFLRELKALHSNRSTQEVERELVIVLVGGNEKDTQGTWVHHNVAMNLAQWISPEFAAWASVVLSAIVNGEFQALTVEAELAEKELADRWQKIRATGKATRRTLTDAIKDWYTNNPSSTAYSQSAMYANTTNAIYRALWDMTALEIEARLGCDRNQLRSYLSEACLKILERAEYRVMEFIDDDSIKPVDAVLVANLKKSKIEVN